MGAPREKFDFVRRWDRLEKLHHLVAVVSREKQPPRRPDTLLAGSTGSSDHGLARPLCRLVADEKLWERVILAAHQREPRRHGHSKQNTYLFTPKVRVVVERYSWPGRRTVEGKAGWFGESGKCWVSRHRAHRFL